MMAKPVTSNRDLVLFLGAGFSCEAGLSPIATFGRGSSREFAALVRRHVNDESPSFKKRELAKRYAKAGGIYSGFQDYCLRSQRWAAIDTGNIEELFSVAEAFANCNVIDTIEFDNRKWNPELVITEIKWWLWNFYKKYPPFDHDWGVSDQPYRELAKTVAENDLTDLLTVITTNYDIVFEIALGCRDIIGHYPLCASSGKSIRSDECEGVYVNDLSEPSGPLIAKLHGSINLFAAKDDPIVRVCNGRKGKRPEILLLDRIQELEKQFDVKLTPEIIPPTYAKLHSKRWLRQMWNAAFKAIRDASRIAFIGYSMPASDGFMRAMIQGAMASRAAKLELDVLVVNPDQKVCDQYRELFAPIGSRCKVANKTFGEAVTDDLAAFMVRKQ